MTIVTHLLVQTECLDVPLGGQQRSALVGVLGRDVLGDGPALEQDETVVVEDRDLAKWVQLHVLLGLVLADGKVDGDKLEWDVLLVQNGAHTLRAGRAFHAVNLDDHSGGCICALT